MRKATFALLAILAAAAAALYVLARPVTIPAAALPAHEPDVANGKYMFTAGGCAECHAAPAKGCDDLEIESKEALGGGRCLKTAFGTFHVPNISPDKTTGIGGWSTLDFVNAMKRGVAPDGSHYYPAFPFTSYQRMRFEDLIDLKAYLDTLPPVQNETPPHDLAFPFNLRRALGLWHRLYVDGESFVPDPEASEEVNRGAYLVRGPGHCTECHSSRNPFGGIVAATEFAGAPNPAGKGTIPNITPSADGIGDWTLEDIVYFFETGNTPDFDVVGGAMAPVQENLAKLTPEDRKAIAAFLKSLPPRPDAVAKAGRGAAE
jgi:mono/diheme cytochrome c family protein